MACVGLLISVGPMFGLYNPKGVPASTSGGYEHNRLDNLKRNLVLSSMEGVD